MLIQVVPMDSKEETIEFLANIFQGNEKHSDEVAENLKENHMEGQDPRITTVVCSDSRVMQQDMWSNKMLGKEFTKGVIGNHVNIYTAQGKEEISGSIDYIPEHSDTETVISVIGHTGCGAITAAYNTLKAVEKEGRLEDIEKMTEKELGEYNGETQGINTDLKLLIDSGLVDDFKQVKEKDVSENEEINFLVERNVDNQIRMLIENTDYENTVILGMVYDMEGFYEGEHGKLYLTNFEGSTDKEAFEKEFDNQDSVRTGRIS